MPGLALFVLGAPRLERDGTPVRVQRRKVMALLVYLAMTGEIYTRDTLAAMFWPTEDQSHARIALRHALSELHKIIGDKVVKTDADRVCLAGSPEFWLDAIEFKRRAAAAQAHRHPPSQPCPDCFDNLSEAARLYRADFLAGFSIGDSAAFDDWLRLETESLRLGMVGVLRRLVAIHQARHEMEPAIQVSRRWLALDPLDEAAHKSLMQLYAASGQRSAALRQYRECARILGSELGVSPLDETTQLYELISQAGKIDATPSAAGAQQDAFSTRRQNNLPESLTSFIGRKKEQAELIGLVKSKSSRLLTITGAGGMGKTRLALQVAEAVLPAFDQGVWLVDLSVLTDPALVTQAVSNTLGISANLGAPYEELLAYNLRGRSLLLVLDNCEHLVNACAHLAVSLLEVCPGLHILVTSREALGVESEVLYPLAPLAVPDAGQQPPVEALEQYEAVQLFYERAAQVFPGFTITQENALAVYQLCQRLDGMPLALELVAARTNSLAIRQIVDHLEAHLWALTASPHYPYPRHRSLQACVDWSYSLLSEPERILLRRLSVFVGGWTLEAAEAVCADPPQAQGLSATVEPGSILGLLAQLVNKSLVTATMAAGMKPQREMRYRLLDTFRHYAFEVLVNTGEEQLLRARHMAYFTRFSEQEAPKLRGPEQSAYLRIIGADRDNLRAAMQWALTGDGAQNEVTQDQVVNGLRLGNALIYYWEINSPFQGALEWLNKGLARIDSQDERWKALRARTLYSIAVLYRSIEVLNIAVQARRTYEKCIELSRSCEDWQILSMALAGLGWLVQSQSMVDESITVCLQLEDPWYRANALLNKSMLVALDAASSLACVQESLTLFRVIGDAWQTHWAMVIFGAEIIHFGNYDTGYEHMRESARFFQERGSITGMIFSSHCWGDAAYVLEDFDQMMTCFQKAIEINRQLGRRGFLVYYLRALGVAYKRLGDFNQAAAYSLESLSMAQGNEDAWSVIMALAGMAGVAAAMNQPIHAVHWWGAVEAQLETLHLEKDWMAQRECNWDTALARAQFDDASFQAAWAEGRVMSLERAIQEAYTLQFQLSSTPTVTPSATRSPQIVEAVTIQAPRKYTG